MTSVKSLSAETYETFGYSNIFYVANPDDNYQATFNEVKDLIGMKFIGALQTNVNCEGMPTGVPQMMLTGSIEYDTGSFTNPLSVGCFFIPPNPKYTHVQLGFHYLTDGSQDEVMYVSNSCGGTTAGFGTPWYASEGAADLGTQAVGAPIPVSSGDSFALIMDNDSGVDYSTPASIIAGRCSFWIIGLGRT